MIQIRRVRGGACALVVALSLTLAAGASANPIKMPTLLKAVQERKANLAAGTPLDPGVTPPAPPCPENGQLPSPFSNCGLPEFPATGAPVMGNMSYWGGPVQVHPKMYLVYWGWGQTDAFPNDDCSPVTFTEGANSYTLPCDPDGAGRYMADFVHQMGGTDWAGVSTQFFQDNADKSQSHIANDKDLLAGVWVDDSVPAGFEKTSGDNKPGDTNTYTLMAREAQRAAEHFGVSGADLINANFVIVQPPGLSDPNALSQGYCAFHDYTQPKLFGGIYDGITPGIVYSNIPYQLAINSSGSNVCGENAVNSGEAGKLDGFSIVLGHEIEEAITDPGAEDVLGGSGVNAQTYLGGWYDPLDANENGDKCAWVGIDPTDFQGTEPVPGAAGNIKGNEGKTFAVQSIWSNTAAGGAGYCAGAGTDLPF